MIGSAQKVEAVFNNLCELGVNPEELKAVHAPIGLNRAQTPAEIAVVFWRRLLVKTGFKAGTRQF